MTSKKRPVKAAAKPKEASKPEPVPEIPRMVYEGKEGGPICSCLLFSIEGEVCIHSKNPCPIAKMDIWRLCTVPLDASINKLVGQLRSVTQELTSPVSSLAKTGREVEAMRLEMARLRETLEGMGGRF